MKHGKIAFVSLLICVFAPGISSAQDTPHSAVTPAAPKLPAVMAHHHSCVDEARVAIERGDGFGMAQPADRSGYPGPRHVLELAAELKLSSAQMNSLQNLLEQMKQKAVARGKEMLAAEERLEKMFQEGRPEADLREQSFRIDSLHAELRWVHLSAHLAAHALLTPQQIEDYQRLRQAHSTP